VAELPPYYHAIIVDQQAQLAKLVKAAGVGPVKRLYEGMFDDLARRLRATESGTFTHQQLQGMVAQVKIGLARVSRGIGGVMETAAGEVGVHAARTILTDAAALEHRFTGALIPMPLLEIGRLRGLVAGQTPSLLRVHATSMATFGTKIARRIETELASSLAQGEDHSQAIDRVAKVGDLEWWRAERIVRTELSYSANASARAAIEEQAVELEGDMWMRWSEHVSDDGMPLDDRVGVDSEAMHGQVAPPGGMFVQPPTNRTGEAVGDSLVGREWACPPNRPNDRAVLVPWRAHWGVPGWQWSGGRRVPVTATEAERTNRRWMRDRETAGPAAERAPGGGAEVDLRSPAEAVVDAESESAATETAPGIGIGFESPVVDLSTREPARPARAIPRTEPPATEIPTQEELRAEGDLVQTMDPAAIAQRGWLEPPGLDRAELQQGVGHINAGQPTPVTLGVTPDDQIVLHAGRGHLNAAADLAEPVRVHWTSSTAEVHPGHIFRQAIDVPQQHGPNQERRPVPPGYELVEHRGRRYYRHLRTGKSYTEEDLRGPERPAVAIPPPTPAVPPPAAPVEIPAGYERFVHNDQPMVRSQATGKTYYESDVRSGAVHLTPQAPRRGVLAAIGSFFRRIVGRR
jgi:hypothetical protein